MAFLKSLMTSDRLQRWLNGKISDFSSLKTLRSDAWTRYLKLVNKNSLDFFQIGCFLAKVESEVSPFCLQPFSYCAPLRDASFDTCLMSLGRMVVEIWLNGWNRAGEGAREISEMTIAHAWEKFLSFFCILTVLMTSDCLGWWLKWKITLKCICQRQIGETFVFRS